MRAHGMGELRVGVAAIVDELWRIAAGRNRQ